MHPLYKETITVLPVITLLLFIACLPVITNYSVLSLDDAGTAQRDVI